MTLNYFYLSIPRVFTSSAVSSSKPVSLPFLPDLLYLSASTAMRQHPFLREWRASPALSFLLRQAWKASTAFEA